MLAILSRQAGRQRSLWGLLVANAISLTGTQISTIALPWYVLTVTGSAGQTGLVAFCGTAPYVLTRALGGPFIDRCGPRRVSVWSDVASAVFCGAIPLLHMAGALPLATLLVLTALLGGARGPGDAAKSALVPQLAESAQLSLERVAGLTSSVSRLAGSIGPTVAGLLVAVAGPLTSVAIDALSFAVAAAMIRATAPGGRAPIDPDEEDTRYRAQLRAGVAYLRRDSLLLRLTLMATMTNLLDLGVMTVLLPVWARHHGGPVSIGLVATAISVTALAGSLIASAWAEKLPRRQTYFAAFLIGGGPRIALLAWGLPTWISVLAWAVSGLALGFINPIVSAVMYERIPAPLIGRVSALTGTLSSAGTPVGGLAAGGLVSAIGLGGTALAYAGSYVTATMVPTFGAGWRQMDRSNRIAEADQLPVPIAEQVDPAAASTAL